MLKATKNLCGRNRFELAMLEGLQPLLRLLRPQGINLTLLGEVKTREDLLGQLGTFGWRQR